MYESTRAFGNETKITRLFKSGLVCKNWTETHIGPAILPPVPFSPFQQHAVHPTAQGGVIGGFLDYKIFLKKEETRIFNQNDPQNSIEIWKIHLFGGVIHDVVAQFINLSL